ncbi:MAG: RNA polymerase sigma factor [Betaproteobacteria bacterium]|nr:RNA polymerase sigma factor [Betaproteobacteria bacterium]
MFARALDQLHRRSGARLLAQLIRRTGRFDVAEDALQDAFSRALTTWPTQGTPHNPEGWLMRVALNRALDHLRREQRQLPGGEEFLATLEADIASLESGDAVDWPDERLKLIFTCCHPSLAPSAQVALSLRTLCGLTTAEIARAFVEPEATTAQKLVRAQRKIAEARIPYQVPGPAEWPERLATVLAVIYFVFNEGYTASESAQLMRSDLCEEALRLGALLAELLPEEPEVLGLGALMAFHHARRATRCDAQGALVPLQDQDRARWDHAAIEVADRQLKRAMTFERPGPYQYQAAIAALHAKAMRAEDTDWKQIAVLYRGLQAHTDTPVIALNAAVAQAMAGQLDEGLARLDALEKNGELDRYHLLHAARADLLRRAGRIEQSRAAYERALTLVQNDAEREYLERRMKELASSQRY